MSKQIQQDGFDEAEKRIQKALRKGAKKLELRDRGLTELPESIGLLTQLQMLDLYSNHLTTLPESISHLTHLQMLELGNNELTALPESIGQLTQVQRLYLYHNQLTTLPESFGQLTQLWRLSLYNNKLAALPESLRKLSALEELYLHLNNALGLPPEVLGPTFDEVVHGKKPTHPAEILDYYFRVRVAKRPLNEAKLILVGRGGVGKTSLVNRLLFDRFDLT